MFLWHHVQAVFGTQPTRFPGRGGGGGGGVVMRQEREADEFRSSAAKVQSTRLTYACHMVLQTQALLF